ncbi:hypothetical protein OSG_eHP14_00090 [environmental Halophage eHP-14]|nr:hypothetical protein OSG_eHP14_00090 [environmental Halophage eHP-14]
MTRRDHLDFRSNDKDSIESSDIEQVEPVKFAEVYASGDGRQRFVADPFGEWVEVDSKALVEVRA